jgi:hypothetical protein
MTEIDSRQPAGVKAPVYRHSSETVRSPNDAGGKVEPSQYTGKDPAPRRDFVR